jgi:hypothetical protein
VIPSNCFIPCAIFKLFMPCDTFNKLFFTIWCFQSVLYHVILSICFIPCDAFKLFYTMWYL